MRMQKNSHENCEISSTFCYLHFNKITSKAKSKISQK